MLSADAALAGAFVLYADIEKETVMKKFVLALGFASLFALGCENAPPNVAGGG